MKGHRIGYVRVSSFDQNPDRQLEGVAVDRVFSDKASGKDVVRPQLEQLLEFVRDGDTVVVHSMDRLARNLDDLRRLVQTLTGRGVRIEFVTEHLTFSGDDSPMANLLLSVMGAFGEFERSLIRERQREGIALAKQRGAYRGRKKALSTEQVRELLERVSAGVPKAAIARSLGISRETLYQYLRSASTGSGDGMQTQTASSISTAVGETDPPKVATIRLWLRIENNNKFVRGRKRALENVERILATYDARELPRGDYELKVPYVTDKELDRRMDDLLREIAMEVDARNCFMEWDARMEGSDRCW